jgi:cbb3-type cytochrome oxidase maturation protein
MSVIYVMLPLAIVLALVALYAFIRAIRTGQFDDFTTPPLRMLDEDDDGKSGEPAPPRRDVP